MGCTIRRLIGRGGVEDAELEPQHVALASSTVALLAMAGVNIIWGAAFPITKPALETIPPIMFALLRFTLALAVLLPLAGGATWRLLRGPDGRRLALMGVVGFCITQLAQTVALGLSPASDIAMIATTTPLWVALLAWPWLGERLSGRAALGFALAVGGLLLIVRPRDGAGPASGQRFLGDAIFLVSAFGWALYNLMGRDLMRRHAPLPATTAAGLVGTLAILPFAAAEYLSGRTPQITLAGVAGVAYTGLLVTVFGFLALFWALGRTSASRVAVMMYFQPLAGVLLAWALLGEPLGAVFLAGAALVCLGVGLVTTTGRKR
jgi:drug/metabolite transporter (DMT)-like permease